ncbi:hypothetical protein [Limibacillus halophilus]|uniref:Uncharacterized protein n=1 Tax=Limibacillus halophilus TaxID=1579333 RepID=A0A839SQ55_9PROT|nr:hypothetical protein [Limibacillus halophilus]MBB3063880.1 hypothetical protein [Limibacillus halophilus]
MMDWHVERRTARISEAMLAEAQLSGGAITRTLNEAQQRRAESLLALVRRLGSALRSVGRMPRPAARFATRTIGDGDCPACG